jgi:hypothetical protein
MKYIKTYESKLNLKNYIAYEGKYGIILILEIEKLHETYVKFKRLFTYNPSQVSRITGKLGELTKNNNDNVTLLNFEINKGILYQTDNLNDLLGEDFLRSLKDINKYNL